MEFINRYCALLTQGKQIDIDTVPQSTAPNTLRRWTKDQLDGLALSPKGQKLVILQARQEQQWKKKYQNRNADSNNYIENAVITAMTWDQFQWCMEVVHSRAFRGNYGLSSIRSLLSAVPSLASIAIGMAYIQGNPNVQDSVLFGLAAIAASPLLFNLVAPDPGEVVLLPFVDSANHLQDADSSIQYDPLAGIFTLSVGSKCLVQERGDDARTMQLYISYGPRSDGELLLNYGFLPELSTSNGNDESSRDDYRLSLTEAFIQRSL